MNNSFVIAYLLLVVILNNCLKAGLLLLMLVSDIQYHRTSDNMLSLNQYINY